MAENILACHLCSICPLKVAGGKWNADAACSPLADAGDAYYYQADKDGGGSLCTGALKDVTGLPSDVTTGTVWNKNNCHARKYLEVCMYLQMTIATGLLIFQTRTRRFIFAGNAPSRTFLYFLVFRFSNACCRYIGGVGNL